MELTEELCAHQVTIVLLALTLHFPAQLVIIQETMETLIFLIVINAMLELIVIARVSLLHQDNASLVFIVLQDRKHPTLLFALRVIDAPQVVLLLLHVIVAPNIKIKKEARLVNHAQQATLAVILLL